MDFKPVHLKVTSHPENLKRIRDLVYGVTARFDLSKKEEHSLVLAVDEVCSNIIRHGYKNDYTCRIFLTISATPSQLMIRIMDEGCSFDITTAARKDPDELRPGGFGIFIVRQVMDVIEYETAASGQNTIRLIKNL